MADEHTRKFNNWDIQKPQRSVATNQYDSNPSVTTDEDMTHQTNDAFDDSSQSDSLGPVDRDDVTQELPTNDAQVTAPADFAQDVSAPTTNETQSKDIDPKTGLPIPDYLKPYTQDLDNNQE